VKEASRKLGPSVQLAVQNDNCVRRPERIADHKEISNSCHNFLAHAAGQHHSNDKQR
jgi:hypothetical protein